MPTIPLPDPAHSPGEALKGHAGADVHLHTHEGRPCGLYIWQDGRHQKTSVREMVALANGTVDVAVARMGRMVKVHLPDP